MKKKFQLIFILMMFTTLTAKAQIRLVEVNPVTGTVSIKNFGTVAVNIASHRLCHLFTYPVISSLTVVSGNTTNLMPGNTVVVSGVNLNATASDLALYLPTGAFTNPNNMLDFVQWGSAGNGRESVAVSKGIWDVGTFIIVAPPYQYTGDGLQQFGVTFWQTLTGLKNNKLNESFNVYPNPVIEDLTIINKERNSVINRYLLINSAGQVVLEQEVNRSKNKIELNLSPFNDGYYYIILNTSKGVLSKKINIIH